MIYPDTPLVEFCKQFDLPTKPMNCETCSAILEMKPMRMNGYACLEYACECGKPYTTGTICTPIKPDKISFWQSIIGGPPNE
jgi:hypothetical protein